METYEKVLLVIWFISILGLSIFLNKSSLTGASATTTDIVIFLISLFVSMEVLYWSVGGYIDLGAESKFGKVMFAKMVSFGISLGALIGIFLLSLINFSDLLAFLKGLLKYGGITIGIVAILCLWYWLNSLKFKEED